MALFDSGAPNTLEDVLGRQAETKGMDLENKFSKQRRKVIGQQAAAGRLGSGVSNYSLADADISEIAGLGGLESDLALALGQIPSEDYVRSREYGRQEELARLIASLNKKDKLGSIIGGIGTGAATGAAVGGPWGAGIGAVGGGVLGGLS
jgi:hypothetical protein